MANQINRQQAVHTFTKGMNKDLDYTLRSNDMYYDAENLRLTTSGGSDNKILKNINGVEELTITDLPAGQYIIGSCSIRDYLILFCSAGSGNSGQIWRCRLDSTGNIIEGDADPLLNPRCIYDDTYTTDGVGSLGWNIALKIKAVGRYENSSLIKVYWTDGVNSTKFANIVTDITITGEDHVALADDYKNISRLEFLPDVVLPELKLYDITTGGLTSGVVQYSYQFYTTKGTESTFSPLTQPIPITSAGYSNTDDSKFYGDLPEVNAGIGFKLKLVNTNVGFDYIRLVAVHYETLDGAPIIRIADEREISTVASDVYLYDSGESLGDYTVEEFSVALNNIFVCKDLEEKDNILFASNITETYFDVDYDARAYRFGGKDDIDDTVIYYQPNAYAKQKAIIQNTEGTFAYTIDGTGSTSQFQTIPDNFDCVCPYNNPDNDNDKGSRMMFQMNGQTLGGTGYNVSYYFDNDTSLHLDDHADDRYYVNNPGAFSKSRDFSYLNYANPLVASTSKGFLKDEVYRFGVVFFDDKGRSSFVKWIGDIRMPSPHDDASFDNVYGADDNEVVLGNVVYPVFTLTNIPAGVTSYRIVYVKRELTDKSILAQGILLPVQLQGSGYSPNSIHAQLSDSNNRLVRFISPEISYGNNVVFHSGDYIEVVSKIYVANTDLYADTGETHGIYKAIDLYSVWDDTDSVGTYIVRGANHYRVIEDAKTVGIDNVAHLIDSIAYDPYNYDNGDPTYYGGTCMAIAFNGTGLTNFHPYKDTTTRYIVNYKRNVNAARYGGNSYEDRSLNQYIPASNIVSSGGTVYCKEGDTFLCYFECLSLVSDLSRVTTTGHYTIHEVVTIPVETSINIPYSRGLNISRNADYAKSHITQEAAGTHSDYNDVTTYVQEYNLYEYNSVYSQQNIINTYFSKPLNWTAVQSYDTRIANSQTKTNNESVDSWTKFLTNDYIEVSTKYGPINNIVNFSNRLFYFQDAAFGIVSVNQRSLISDSNPGELILGTGGILDRYDYISENTGSKNRFGVVGGLMGLYWIDNLKKEIYRFSNTPEPLGYLKGIKSYLNKYDGIEDVVVAYDKTLNEVLVTIHGYVIGTCTTDGNIANHLIEFNNLDIFRDISGTFHFRMIYPMSVAAANNRTGILVYPNQVQIYDTMSLNIGESYRLYFKQTLSFSEPDDCFNGFFTFIPDLYIHTPYAILSTYTGNTGSYKIGRHNTGTKQNSRLSILVNDNPMYTKVFDSVSLLSRTTDVNGVDQYDTSFSSYRVISSYQNTGWKTLSINSGTMERRDRHFSFAIPRNIISIDVSSNPNLLDPTSVDSTGLYKDRIRDKYCKIDFKHTANSHDFSLSYINARYRISYR